MDEKISGVILNLYEGVHDQTRWDMAVEEICSLLDVKWMLIAQFDERKRAPVGSQFYRIPNSRFMGGWLEYLDGAFSFDPTNDYAARNPAGGVFDLAQCMPSDAYFEHEFVRWNRANMSSSFWQLRYAGRDGLRLGVSLHRSASSGPLGPEDNRLFGLFYEHMALATRIAARPPLIEGPDIVIMVDHQAEVLAMSEMAANLLRAQDGLAILARCIRPLSHRSAAEFDRALAKVIAAPAQLARSTALLIEREDRPPLYMTIDPVPQTAAALSMARPAATIRLIEPASKSPQADWRALFGFTKAESRLAGAILSGDGNLRQTADQLGIAYATARAQLASLFQKAGVHSQVGLVKLLTRLGVMLAVLPALARVALDALGSSLEMLAV